MAAIPLVKSGHRPRDGSQRWRPLLQQEAVQALVTELLPHALITTPNIPEAELLTGMSITNLNQREEAARQIVQMGSTYALVKGGHDEGSGMIVDVLYDGQSFHYLENVRVVTRHTHGTGCTYSAAITAELAKVHLFWLPLRLREHSFRRPSKMSWGLGPDMGRQIILRISADSGVSSDAPLGCRSSTTRDAGVFGDGQR